jgi:hypothetical protein
MKKSLVVLILALLFSNTWATEPEGKNAPAMKSTQIVGKVTDVATGEALVGVSLKLKGCDSTTYTDLDGNFKIEGVTPGTYNIEVDYVSYKNITLTEVSASSSNLNLKVELEPVSLPL